MAQDPNTFNQGPAYNTYTAKHAGVAASAQVFANQSGDGNLEKTVLVLQDAVVTLVDNPGVVAYGSLAILTMPAGLMNVLGATANLTVTKSSAGVNATFDGDFGVGTAAANNGATLATTEQNVIPTTATPQAVAGATTAKGGATAVLFADGTASPVTLYLNMLVDDADHDVTATPANLLVSGTITLVYANLGDY